MAQTDAEQMESAEMSNPQSTCMWTYDEDGSWDTSCSNKFTIFEGTPKENGMKFCCYCGATVKEKLKEDADCVSPL